MNETKKVIQYNYPINIELAKRIKIEATLQGKTQKDLINECLDKYIPKHNTKAILKDIKETLKENGENL